MNCRYRPRTNDGPRLSVERGMFHFHKRQLKTWNAGLIGALISRKENLKYLWFKVLNLSKITSLFPFKSQL
jgi:hypothetical protein